MDIASNIRRAAKSRGTSLRDVADKLGMSNVALSASINGNPTMATLERVAGAIGCDISEFFSNPGEGALRCPHCGRPIHIHID